MSLDKQNIIMIFGNNAQSFATLEELKDVLGGGGNGGAVADDPDFKALVGRVGEVETALNGKITSPIDPSEGYVLQFVAGKWVAVPPSSINGGAF